MRTEIVIEPTPDAHVVAVHSGPRSWSRSFEGPDAAVRAAYAARQARAVQARADWLALLFSTERRPATVVRLGFRFVVEGVVVTVTATRVSVGRAQVYELSVGAQRLEVTLDDLVEGQRADRIVCLF